MQTKDYFIGLDVGTESVGWAVTDAEYNILKFKGNGMWGVRLFDEAKTAEERRIFRTSRRRLQRRRQRLDLLENFFNEEISRVDVGFFQRLKESKFLLEDKLGDVGKYTLFNDKNYTDKDYHDKYPTIYHLRKALIEDRDVYDEKTYSRLVFLALHHIMKNRGHFLFDDLGDKRVSFELTLEGITDLIKDLKDDESERVFKIDNIEDFKNILKDRSIRIQDKKSKLFEVSKLDKRDKLIKGLVDLLAGAKANITDMFGYEKSDEIPNISFKESFEEKASEYEEKLSDNFKLILEVKKMYDWAILENILKGEDYISYSKVKDYEKHKEDLALLKEIVKVNLPNEYNEIFKMMDEKVSNYVNYSGNGDKKSSYEDFSQYLKKKLETLRDEGKKYKDERIEIILNELDLGLFLPKQTIKENGVIPCQIHKAELKAILENASKYLEFLVAKDETNLSIKDKLIKTFEFRIPYYVGPLAKNKEKSKFAWLVRKDEKIYPWNFEDVVNLEKSAENFIMRMTAKCSYIGEDVIPENSLLYSKFKVLNEINNIKINGHPISVETKQKIYNELFIKNKKVTMKKLRDFLRAEGLIEKDELITGIDKDIKGSLNSYLVFKNLLNIISEEEVEEIIKRVVLFGDDKRLLRKWLEKYLGDKISNEDIKYISKQKFGAWGRLSKEFLTEIEHVDKKTGEMKSIIKNMWETNNNLMELLSNKFTYVDEIKKYRDEKSSTKTNSIKEYIEESYASPSIKRAILQGIKIVEEIVKIKKYPPKRIFLEMARGEEEKKRTVSRKNKLVDLYKNCKGEEKYLYESLQKYEDGDLRRDALYLYYTQKGRCMYSGDKIEISELYNKNTYDIDHIYPQSRVKDDSLDNRVLVKKTINSIKGNTYPIKEEIRKAQYSLWSNLKSDGLISQKKFDRLTRHEPFSEEELANFIARQLVETRQSSKIIGDILEKKFDKDTEIVYVKAGNVSTFRQDMNNSKEILRRGLNFEEGVFTKCREVNDFHHGKDAYLNIVVGNVYHVKFTKNPLLFIKGSESKNYSLNRVFDFKVERNNEIAWEVEDNKSLKTVIKTMKKNNLLFTRMAREEKGGFYRENILKSGKGQIAIKSDERMKIDKYGGYDKERGSYYLLVEHTLEKDVVRTIEVITVKDRSEYEANPEDYCLKKLKLKNTKILIKNLKIKSLLSYNNFKMHIASRSNSSITISNANQLILDPNWSSYIKRINNYIARCITAKKILIIKEYDGITLEKNLELYKELLDKLESKLYSVKYKKIFNDLIKGRGKFDTLNLKNQCEILLEIIKIVKCNVSDGDLKHIGGAGRAGNLSINQNIYKMKTTKEDKLYLINQSVTGLFEEKIDLFGEF